MPIPSSVHWVHLGAEAIDADTGYVLVDLSDTTNYHHAKTNGVHVCELHIGADAQSGTFDLWFGVILEVDASNGTPQWFHVAHIEKATSYNEQINYICGGLNPEGIDLTIVSGATIGTLSNLEQAGNTTWQTDTGLASPVGAAAGATGKPGAGDVVMWCEEVSAGTVDFDVSLGYYAT